MTRMSTNNSNIYIGLDIGKDSLQINSQNQKTSRSRTLARVMKCRNRKGTLRYNLIQLIGSFAPLQEGK